MTEPANDDQHYIIVQDDDGQLYKIPMELVRQHKLSQEDATKELQATTGAASFNAILGPSQPAPSGFVRASPLGFVSTSAFVRAVPSGFVRVVPSGLVRVAPSHYTRAVPSGFVRATPSGFVRIAPQAGAWRGRTPK
jgi:hypothetical protein